MTERTRPHVAIVSDDAEVRESLNEWLNAAGFASVAATQPQPHVVAHIATWPLPDHLTFPSGPTILLIAHELTTPPAVPKHVTIVRRPDPGNMRSLLEWSKELSEALRRAMQVMPQAPVATIAPAPIVHSAVAAQPPNSAHSVDPSLPSLIAIGISTGGPEALLKLMHTLMAADLPPIAIVQHIPANFVADLAQRLYTRTNIPVHIAEDGAQLRRSTVTIAPGDKHMRLNRTAGRFHVQLTNEPERRGHRPSADVLFESCAELGIHGIGVVMTGMGRDGAEGLLELRRRKWRTIAQDATTSTIYGMPRAAMEAGGVEAQLPLEEIGPRLRSWCYRASSRAR